MKKDKRIKELECLNKLLIAYINDVSLAFYLSTHVSKYKTLHPNMQLVWKDGQSIFEATRKYI